MVSLKEVIMIIIHKGVILCSRYVIIKIFRMIEVSVRCSVITTGDFINIKRFPKRGRVGRIRDRHRLGWGGTFEILCLGSIKVKSIPEWNKKLFFFITPSKEV